jgi:predicted nucleotidyltransferase
MKNRILELHEIVRNTGFEFADSMIHLYVGGSEAHGAKLPGLSDLDLYGVYILPPRKALGIPEFIPTDFSEEQRVAEKPEQFNWTTKEAKRARNIPDDVEFHAFSLRAWAAQAAKGNSNSLHFLFSPNLSYKPSSWEKHIRPNANLFLSSHAGFHYQEFALAQLKRLHGESTGKHGQRPELTEQFGYDTKGAMHVIRILHEGIELMMTGKITLPRPEKDLLIKIRKGEFGTLADIDALAKNLFTDLTEARLASELPPEVDRPAISLLVSETYLDFWTGGFWSAKDGQEADSGYQTVGDIQDLLH